VEEVPASCKSKGLGWQPSLTAAIGLKGFFAALATLPRILTGILVTVWVVLAIAIMALVVTGLVLDLAAAVLR
jgi:hypothetical protein